MTTTPSTSSALVLNTGASIPQIGFGFWQVDDARASTVIEHAFDVGYRLIDTAEGYDNEVGVGEGVRQSDVPRDEVFVTTKLANPYHGRDAALRAFDGSLEKLGLDRVDLFLIHWPLPMFDQYVESWQALEEIAADGRASAIGVSNFGTNHLERLFSETGTVPAVNQVELHPYLPQDDLRRFHSEHGIVTEAWSPIGQGGDLLAEPVIAALADAHGRTPAQVVLRWHVQLGNVAIPKSVTPARIAENFEVFDFELSDDDMTAIGTLATGRRLGPDPDSFRGGL